MTEITRFLRYVLPGLSAVIQLMVALSITEKCFFTSLLKNQNISGMFGVFLASGALGYIFSNIYFPIYWCQFAVDYRVIFQNLQDKIELKNDKGCLYENKLSEYDAYSIIDQYWHSNKEDSNMLKGVTPGAERLNDIMHGLGASIIGSIFAFIAWIILACKDSMCDFFNMVNIILIILWIVLMWSFYKSFAQTKAKQQSLVNSTMTAFINKKYIDNNKQKVQIYYIK